MLLAALLHAGWNTIVKASLGPRGAERADAGTRLLTPALVVCVSSLAGLGMASYAAPPAAESWPALAASVLIHTAYFVFLMLSYRAGDMSQVYPIARGIGPLIVALASGLVFGELLGVSATLGVALISIGVASLAWSRRLLAPEERLAVAFAVLTGLTIAAYTVVDAVGVRRSGSPLGYAAWLMMLTGLPFAAYVFRRAGRSALPFLAARWRAGVVGGLMTFAAYALVLWALSLGAVAPIAALRETSVVIAAVIGAVFLGEGFGRRRVVAACAVAAGVVLLNLPA